MRSGTWTRPEARRAQQAFLLWSFSSLERVSTCEEKQDGMLAKRRRTPSWENGEEGLATLSAREEEEEADEIPGERPSSAPRHPSSLRGLRRGGA